MLQEVLGVLIGFVGVVLVLSLLVTAVVQFIQNVLALRAKNLRVGLQALFEKLKHEGTLVDPKDRDLKTLKDEIVAKIPFVPKIDSNPLTRWISPTATWVSEEELLQHLKSSGVELAKDSNAEFSLLFRRMEDYISKRFILSVRLITIVCAIVVATYFQVSTPSLLKRLYLDPTYRAQTVRASEDVAAQRDTLPGATNFANASEIALEKLTASHPGQAPYLERVSGAGASREEIVEELKTALSPLPPLERATILKEYEELLDNLHQKASADARKRIGELTDRLAGLDITPWPQGWSYFKTPANIVGVLITAAFLTFGAPFWFERLRELIQLRDALKPKREKESGSQDEQK